MKNKMKLLLENFRKYLNEAAGDPVFKGYLGWEIPNELVDVSGVDERYIKNRIQRDGQDAYHITIISPPETRQIVQNTRTDMGLSGGKAKKEAKRALLERAASLAASEFNIGVTKSVEGPGDGSVGVSGEPSVAFFKVVDWPEVQILRAEYGLPRKDLHITLGIGDNGDVHGVEKAQITWKKPDIPAERGEFELHAPHFGLTAEELEGYIENNGKLIPMNKGTALYNTLDNTQMQGVESIDDLDEIGKENKKDFKGIKQGIEDGSSFNAPIVVKQGDKPPFLIAGNTRLMAAAAYGITPQVWYVKIDENE